MASEQYPYSFGKYRVEAEIGRGGFGNVYRAVDTPLERPIALKVLDPIYMRDRTWINRFRREAIVMAQLDHPNIVPIYDTGEIDGRLYLAMKLVDGPNLDEVLKQRGRLTWEEALTLVRQIAAALDYAHDKGVLHRDLKPANVLLDDERALLTDFGLARLVGSNTMSMSTHGGIAGTYQYMAPELFDDEEPLRAADVYALGCILYEAVTGDVLFDAGSTAAIISAHLRPLELPETLAEDVPPGLADVLHIALARAPDARYQSGAELVAALENIESDRLSEPYAALEQAVAWEEWETALQLADTIHAADANYRDVQALRARAQQGQEAVQMQQWAAKWREEAETALAQDDVMTAEVALKQWRRVAADDDAGVAAFAGRLDLLRRYQDLEQAIKEKRWVEAQPVAEAIREQEPTFRDVTALAKRIKAERQSATAEISPHEPEKTSTNEERTVATMSGAWRVIPIWVWGMGAVLILVLLAGGAVALLGDDGNDGDERNGADTGGASAELTQPIDASLGDTWTRPADGMEMVYVPAGSFQMGSAAGDNDERPVHEVTLDAFWIDRTEVTNAQYEACVADGACAESQLASNGAFNGANYPVVAVLWNDAEDYCTWAGARLPTEAQWEYAARGPDGFFYPWGNTFDGSLLNFCDGTCGLDWADESADDGYEQTAPVGSYPAGASWVGALDMAGNVWEYVQDWYDEVYYARSPAEDPPGPSGGDFKVIRGGSWLDGSGEFVRASNRGTVVVASIQGDDVGFRCASLGDEQAGVETGSTGTEGHHLSTPVSVILGPGRPMG